MNKYFLIFILLLCSSRLYAQSDSIRLEKGFDRMYIRQGKKLSPMDFIRLSDGIPGMYKEAKMAKNNMDVAVFFAGAGGVFLGWGIADAVIQQRPRLGLFVVGAALCAVSISLSSAYHAHATKATYLYNANLGRSAATCRPDMHFYLAFGSCGFRLSF